MLITITEAMETLTERELELTDLILQHLEEDKEANTSKLAEYEHLENLSDAEKKERYWHLFRVISRYLDAAYIHDKKNISIRLNPSISETVKELRKTGGIRTIQKAEHSRLSKLKEYLFGKQKQHHRPNP